MMLTMMLIMMMIIHFIIFCKFRKFINLAKAPQTLVLLCIYSSEIILRQKLQLSLHQFEVILRQIFAKNHNGKQLWNSRIYVVFFERDVKAYKT
jgi:hypothetical protein